jgi:hypothetical protein
MITVNDIEYGRGTGRTKGGAREAAAAAAIQFIYNEGL